MDSLRGALVPMEKRSARKWVPLSVIRVRWAAFAGMAIWVLAGAPSAIAKPSPCNEPAAKPIVKIDVPGRPFEALASADGCWIFASLAPEANRGPQARFSGADLRKWNREPPRPRDFRGAGGIAVLRRVDGKVKLKRVVRFSPRAGGVFGIAFANDGKWLVATVPGAGAVVFLDVHRMETGKGNPFLGSIRDGERAGSIYAVASADGRFLFVSDERLHQVSAIDLDKARRTNFAQSSRIGSIPVGLAPVGLAFSSDNRYLFITSEVWGRIAQLPSGARIVVPMQGSGSETRANRWPMTCHPEVGGKTQNGKPIWWPEGAISVVDLARAEEHPARAVVGNAPAGCIPVRVVVAPDGKTVYVTARESNALLAFDAEKLVTDPEHALVGRVVVGRSPVGLAVVDRGRKAGVANSSRFGGSGGRDLTVVSMSGIREGQAKLEGTIPAGAFPRELHMTPDGRTLILTNFGSEQLELIDLDRLRRVLEPVKGSPAGRNAAKVPVS